MFKGNSGDFALRRSVSNFVHYFIGTLEEPFSGMALNLHLLQKQLSNKCLSQKGLRKPLEFQLSFFRPSAGSFVDLQTTTLGIKLGYISPVSGPSRCL